MTSFRELFDSGAPALLRYVRRLTGSRSDAEEIVQDTFLKLHRRMTEEAGDLTNARAWLFRVATNAARDLDRERRVRAREAQTAALDPTVIDFEAHIERRQLTRRALRRLAGAGHPRPAGSSAAPLPHRALRAEPLRVLYVGRLESRKNVDLLLESIKLADVGADVRVVGTGEQESRLRQFARELGIDNRVEFRGFRADRALLDEFRWADCFVMPSVYEGMPLTVLEARSCALPVISSPFEGSRAMIPESTGIVLKAPAAREMFSSISVPPRSFTPAWSTCVTPALPIFTHEVWMLGIQPS